MKFRMIWLVLLLTALLCGCSYQDEVSSGVTQASDHVHQQETSASTSQVPDQTDPDEISPSEPETASNEEKTLFLIYRYPANYSRYQETTGGKGTSVSESDWLDDEVLQTGIHKYGWEYPLEITAVAWDLYELFVREGRMEAEYVPYTALRFTDGIWSISFLPEESHGSYYDGKSYGVLISANDGHIIDFGTRY